MNRRVVFLLFLLAALIGSIASGQTPPDDGHRWHVAVFHWGGDAASTKLIGDAQRSEGLQALANPAKFNFNLHDLSLPVQQAHFADWKIVRYPTIVICPPRNDAVYPYQYVYRHEGYDGDAASIASDAAEAIQQFCTRYSPVAGGWLFPNRSPQPSPAPCPGPGPCPVPVTPAVPSPFAVPAPVVPYSPIPDLPPRGVSPAVTAEIESRQKPVVDAIASLKEKLARIEGSTSTAADAAKRVDALAGDVAKLQGLGARLDEILERLKAVNTEPNREAIKAVIADVIAQNPPDVETIAKLSPIITSFGLPAIPVMIGLIGVWFLVRKKAGSPAGTASAAAQVLSLAGGAGGLAGRIASLVQRLAELERELGQHPAPPTA